MNQAKHPTWTLRKIPTGPLAIHLNGYSFWLYELSFCRPYIGRQIRQVAQFSCWLARNDIAIGDITDCCIAQYFEEKNSRRLIKQGARASLHRFMKYLDRIGIALPKPNLRPLTPIEVSLNNFGSYLLNERALSPKTFVQYRPTIEKFLVFKFGYAKIDLNLIVGADIIQFVQAEANRLSTARGKVVVNAMRAFLRYGMHRYQLSPRILSAVPKVASWSQPGIVKAISPEDIEKLLLSCDSQTLLGVRDFAVLLLLARLGLRAAEIALLSLDAIDWESGTLLFSGKSGKHACLPLPEDVAKALAAYLRLRPVVPSRLIFIRIPAPLTPLGAPQSVISIVNSAIKRAEISPPTKGTHQFRHGLATSMLKSGANLMEIGSILRHEQTKTTNLYAKVNIESLRSLSPVWPGGEL